VGLPGTKPVADRSQVRRTNKPTEGAEWRQVEDVPHDGPALGPRARSAEYAQDKPAELGGTPMVDWPQATLDWWEDVRTMPHAALWSPAEWRTARAAAETHARFVEGWKGCATGAELRQREKLLGMTYDALRDQRIRYVPAKTKDEAGDLPDNVAKLDDFRDL
jgi:hypothetical protein